MLDMAITRLSSPALKLNQGAVESNDVIATAERFHKKFNWHDSRFYQHTKQEVLSYCMLQCTDLIFWSFIFHLHSESTFLVTSCLTATGKGPLAVAYNGLDMFRVEKIWDFINFTKSLHYAVNVGVDF